MEQIHIMLDIEALGLRPGNAIFELGAVPFCPETGKVGGGFERRIDPAAPYTADLDTLEWHRTKGTWPKRVAPGEVVSMSAALQDFEDWLADLGDIAAFWSWGSTYDFPLLTAAYDREGLVPPWKYYQCQCARTVWRVCFGDRRREARPHTALEDSVAAARDLMEAMGKLTA